MAEAEVGLPCSCPEPVRGTLPDDFLKHVQEGTWSEIEEWLSSGGDVNAATEGGLTLLSASCIYKRIDVVQKLLEYPSIHLNTKHRLGILRGFTPLCIAAYKGLPDITTCLLGSECKCRLDLGATTAKGTSALRQAAEKGHWDVVELLAPRVSFPEEDSNAVTSLARWANKSNLIPLFKREHPKLSVSASDSVYENTTKPRGLVLILNYKFKGIDGMERRGTDGDVAALKETFNQMDYETQDHCDLTLEDTRDKLTKFCSQDRLKDIGSVVVVVLSHGKNRNTFCTKDCMMTMTDLCSYFVPKNCPLMKDKPKIFLLQFCRGKYSSKQLNLIPSSDADRIWRDALTDMMCLYAAQEGFEALRLVGNEGDPYVGTPFIHSFCRVLKASGHKWLDDLIRDFIDEYANTYCGQPLDAHNLCFRRKFCFNPAAS